MELFVCPVLESGNQAEHNTAHRLLAAALWETYGLQEPILAYGANGKPYLCDHPDLHFNLSHCRGLAVCAVGTSPLGVDAEYIRPLRERVLRRVFSPEETTEVQQSQTPDETFFRIWTLKESFVKAIGVGISYPMQSITFSLRSGEIHSSEPAWQFGQLQYKTNWMISFCISPDEIIPTVPRLLL